MCKTQKKKTFHFITLSKEQLKVQYIFEERHRSMKENCLWGRCKKKVKKTNNSAFSATNTYIKLTLVSFFLLFFLHLPLRWFKLQAFVNCKRPSVLLKALFPESQSNYSLYIRKKTVLHWNLDKMKQCFIAMMLISLQKYILELYVFAKFWRVRSQNFYHSAKFKLG